MTEKLERRFGTWEEFSAEWESNLKNFGLFIPGEFQIELRKKIQALIWLPGAENAIPAQAEVVAAFPAGIALHLEESADWLKQIQEKMIRAPAQQKSEDTAPAGAETAPAPGEKAEAKEEVSEEDKKELAEAISEPVSEEEVEKIEKKLSASGMDLSNLYLAIRRLSKTEKIQLAKRGNRKVLSILIQEGDRMLFRFLIQNPHLTASEVLQIFKHPAITTEIITELARNPVWGQNEEIRYQMVIHPKTPLPTSLTLLNAINQKQLAAIAKSQHIRTQLKSNALKLLIKRRGGEF